MTTAPLTPPPSRMHEALRIAAFVLSLALVVLLNFVPVNENDLWLQTRIGRMIVADGTIPRTVLFTFTEAAGNAFNAHEWLPSILFHGLDRWPGHDGLLYVQGGIGLLQWGLGLALAWRLSRSAGVALLLSTFAMGVANYRYFLRPELFALVLLMLLLMVLTRFVERPVAERRARVLLWTLPIAVIWANVHGSFLLGPVIAALFAAGEAIDAMRRPRANAPGPRAAAALAAGGPLALAAGAMLAASIVNPMGFELVRFALALKSSAVVRQFIFEWVPTLSLPFVYRLPQAFALFMIALAFTATVMWRQRRALAARELLLVVAFAALALQSNRFVALFGFVALPVCARLLGTRVAAQQRTDRACLAAAAGVGALGLALVVPLGNVYGAFPYESPSNDMTPYMAELVAQPGLQGNVLNSYELGDELVYRSWPALKPSIDSRIDSYGGEYFMRHAKLFGDEAALDAFIARYDVRYMLLLRSDFQKVKAMPSIYGHWHMRFADHRMVLLQRNDVPTIDSGPIRAK